MSSVPKNDDAYPEHWGWDEHGLTVAGTFIRMAEGASAYGTKAIIILDVDGTERSVWVNAESLRAKLADELERRSSRSFEPGERIIISRGAEKKVSAADRSYWPFRLEFPDAAQRDAADLLGAHIGEKWETTTGDEVAF